ncbi:hypothetical protein LINGRAHAP2_LOCUS30435, partial [Linum grandiflorum]
MEKYYSRKAKIVDKIIDKPNSDGTTQLPNVLSTMQPQLPLTSKLHPYQIRRAYIEKGPCQPRGYSFPYKDMFGFNRKFNPAGFDAYYWLEYSVKEDVAYCLHCYLFKQEGSSNQGGGDYFTSNGFT